MERSTVYVESDLLFALAKDTDWLKADAKAAAAEQTGNEDFHHVSSHDLRRRSAQRSLVDENLNPRVVMQVGGS